MCKRIVGRRKSPELGAGSGWLRMNGARGWFRRAGERGRR